MTILKILEILDVDAGTRDDSLDHAFAILALARLGRLERSHCVLECITMRDERFEVNFARSNEGNGKLVIAGLPGHGYMGFEE